MVQYGLDGEERMPKSQTPSSGSPNNKLQLVVENASKRWTSRNVSIAAILYCGPIYFELQSMQKLYRLPFVDCMPRDPERTDYNISWLDYIFNDSRYCVPATVQQTCSLEQEQN